MKETKFKQTLVQTKEGSRHCERSEAIQGGFKMTEIGLVPNDWDVASMGMLVDFQGGSQPDLKYFRSSYKDGYIRLIQIRDYKTDKYIVYIPESMARKKCLTSDIMIGRYGPPIFQILRGIEGAYNVALIKVIPKSDRINQEFLFYTLKRDDLFAIIDNLSRRSSGQTGVDLVALREWLFALPTIEEQQRIANALSDVDTLINNLEKLIAKKKNIKQGAMQQPLTGKKRLPGFGSDKRTGSRPTDERRKECHSERSAKREESSGYKMTELGMIPTDWEVKNLGSITQNCSYGVGAEAVSFNGRTKYIRITDIDDDSHRFIPSPLTSPSFYENKHVVQENDLLIARTGASVGKTYLYDSKDGKLIFAGFLIKMNVCEANSKFVFYSTLTKYYQDWIVSESARTGQPGVNLQQMKKLQIALPPTIEEQTAIANVLSDMDTEIATLETKLAKYRKLKTGMMQQLLTGKVRLV